MRRLLDGFAKVGRRTLIMVTVFSMLLVAAAPGALARPPATESTDGRSMLEVARTIRLATKRGNALVHATGAGVQIALIDTGIVDVEGLRSSNVMIGPDFSFEGAAENLVGRDTNGHGTHLAGIMVGADEAWRNGDTRRSHDRTIGIAPDAELVSIKVAGADGAVDVTQVIAAINWVIEHSDDPGMNIRVLALAYGTDSFLPYELDPLAYVVERAWNEGIVVVAAGGNDGNEADELRMPARDPFVIAVGSTDATSEHRKNGTVSGYSNGSDARAVDLVAPGRSVISLRVPGAYSDNFNEAGRVGDDLVRGSGSSQATAVTAAAVALLLEARPELTPDEVKHVLRESATPLNDVGASIQGAGLLNLRQAMNYPIRGDVTQAWAPSTGEGSINLARGTAQLVIDGVPLDGETDIFGNSWSAERWTVDAWSGNSWSGNSWSGNSWSGNSWSGNSWSGNSWSGNSWSGNSWSGNSWSGNSWSGNSWSGNSWSGNSWSGNSWSGNSWSGNSWSGNSWSGNSWSGNTWS